jgi:hypothetical protein
MLGTAHNTPTVLAISPVDKFEIMKPLDSFCPTGKVNRISLIISGQI